MGIQSFFKQRRPRQFQHKLIYWDPKKEELEQRVERIRKEMIEAGELDESVSLDELASDRSTASEQETLEGYDASRQVRGSFVQSTRHLRRQQKQGVTSSDRGQRMVRLMLYILGLGLIFWYFFLR